MTKLAILIYSLAGGGAERVVSILLDELKDTYDITLVLMNDTIHYSLPENQKIIYLENSSPNEQGFWKLFKLPLLGLKYKKICIQNNIDTTLSFMNRPNYIALFSKIFGNASNIIISERSQPSLQHKRGMQGFINRILIKFLYPKADKIIANSLGNSLDLENKFDVHPVYTINNPFDLAKIHILSREYCEIARKKFTFVTVGRLDAGKNHSIIIDAIKDLDAELWIIGEGPLRNTLQAKIKELHLEDSVYLLGRQDNPFKYLSKADCFVFSSNHEGFPNVLVEALACALPIISTDCPSGPREILAPDTTQDTHLKTGIEIAQYAILTPINDSENLKKAMHTIITDKDMCNSYRTRNIQRAQDFSKEKISLQFINSIQNLNYMLKGKRCVE